MTLIDEIEQQLKDAMRAREPVRTGALRLTLAALRSAEKELGRELKEDEELQVLQRERKRRAEDGVDCVRADRVTALDELGELVDDQTRLADAPLVALERELVAAQTDGATHPVAEGAENAVVDGGELGGDLVGDGENFLQLITV